MLTKTPLRSYAVTSDYGEGVRSDVVYEAFADPFAFSLDIGADIGKDHYESMGRVTGTVTAGGTEAEVAAWGYQDHSWGPRSWGCSAGPPLDLGHLRAGPVLLRLHLHQPGRQAEFGYVFDGGEFHGVTRVDTGARVADDGHSPAGCDARLWTADGRGYHITGACDVTSVGSHDDGFFVTDALTTYECGGRLGTGIFEVNELPGPTATHRAPSASTVHWLGIDAGFS